MPAHAAPFEDQAQGRETGRRRKGLGVDPSALGSVPAGGDFELSER